MPGSANYTLSMCAVAMLAGCNSGASQFSPSSTIRQSEHAASQRKLATADLYVVNGGNSVTVYVAGAHGHAAPIRTISGSNTELSYPQSLALDANENVYATSGAGASEDWLVAVYAAGANGNVTPKRTISGPNTELQYPRGIALDADGTTYVLNTRAEFWGVTVYAAGANGNVTPERTISGSNTGLVWPSSIALDTNAEPYVLSQYHCIRGHCSGADQITVYAAGANGNVSPIRTISGSNTRLKTPIGVALDADNNIYVANVNNSVTVYAAAANGNVAPIQAIAGPSTGLKSPRGIALGPDGRIYVMNGWNGQKGSVTVYATGANGNVAPIQNIHGSKTGLAEPLGGAVR